MSAPIVRATLVAADQSDQAEDDRGVGGRNEVLVRNPIRVPFPALDNDPRIEVGSLSARRLDERIAADVIAAFDPRKPGAWGRHLSPAFELVEVNIVRHQ